VEKKLPETLNKLIADWGGTAPVKLMFQDEARFGRISDIRRCWAPFPMRPLCRGMLTHEYTYAYGAVDVVTGEFDSLILPHVNTGCTQVFLDEIAARHPQHRIVMVMDGAGWHRSAALKPSANLRLLSLPPYAPELNPVEHLWDELREKHFHNKAFDSIEALEDQLVTGLLALEHDPDRVKSIVAWDWIINALLK
jgi:DDE superfamily endonuclease